MSDNLIQEQIKQDYAYGFVTDVESVRAPKGLNKEVIQFISKQKNEPEWLLAWRLKAFDRLQLMTEPNWQKPQYPKIDYQALYYYSAPKSFKEGPKSLDEIDPEIKKTYEKLGIPLNEQKRLAGVAVDAVFDSVSVATTFKKKLEDIGIIFCSISEAVQKHPDLVKKYLGSVIPLTDHYFATLNSAVFTDGSFVYIPEGVRCPMELSTYFRINASNTGGICKGKNSKISWTQVETGSAITWKYPSCILQGDNSSGEFYSIAITNNYQKADTGTKMIHLGKNTKSRIISKGISAGHADNTYRGLVSIHPKASNAKNYTQCDSLLVGNLCGAHTVPYIDNKNSTSTTEHEATTSKISEEQLFYCKQRGLNQEEAVSLIVNGFCKEVLQQLPMEFAVEAQKLVSISLEGSVG